MTVITVTLLVTDISDTAGDCDISDTAGDSDISDTAGDCDTVGISYPPHDLLVRGGGGGQHLACDRQVERIHTHTHTHTHIHTHTHTHTQHTHTHTHAHAHTNTHTHTHTHICCDSFPPFTSCYGHIDATC